MARQETKIDELLARREMRKMTEERFSKKVVRWVILLNALFVGGGIVFILAHWVRAINVNSELVCFHHR